MTQYSSDIHNFYASKYKTILKTKENVTRDSRSLFAGDSEEREGGSDFACCESPSHYWVRLGGRGQD